MTPTERKLAAQLAAHTSWANTTDRTARTAKARAAMTQKFLDEAAGDPVRADSLRKAFYARLALKSVVSRRRAAGQIAAAEEAEANLALLDGPES